MSATFLARLGGRTFIRALWLPKHNGEIPAGFREAYSFYVAPERFANVLPELKRLNAAGFSIFYGANDPQCNRLSDNSCEIQRLIYRDCDFSEDPVSLILNGQAIPPHIHILTSPGKSQSLWLTEDIPAEHHRAIHHHLVANYGHDKNTFGTGRLLRLPGFANTKYPERPSVAILASLDTPRLEVARVLRGFGIGAKLHAVSSDGANVLNTMNRAQSSGGAGRIARAEIAPAQRGDIDREAERLDARQASTGRRDNLKREDLLIALSRIDPDTAREEWFRVGAALHHMFDGSSTGFDVFDSWSRLGGKYTETGQSTTHKLWTGFKDERETICHLGTIQFLSSLYAITPATRRRLNSVMFNALRLALDEQLSVRTLSTHYPFQIWAEKGTIPDPQAIGNIVYQLMIDYPNFHFNDFTNEIHINSEESLTDQHVHALWANMHRNHCRVSMTMVEQTLKDFAYQKRRNPAIEYFQALEDRWDGHPRLDRVFIDHLGAPDNSYIREMTRLLFVAIIRRAYEPGFKFDMMPIFEGLQGLGKSSLFKRLIPNIEWFSDAPRMDLDEKRFYPLIQGKLIIEFAELDGKSRAELGRIKKIVTQTRDEYIGMYGRHKSRISRTAIFIGSTNETEYLRDMSGNRRFPVIPVTKELNYKAIDAEARQIWAEAVFLEPFIDDLRLSKESIQIMEEMQDIRLDLDNGVQEMIDELSHLGGGLLTRTTILEALGLDNDKKASRYGSHAKYTFKQIKDCLYRCGWEQVSHPIRIGNHSYRGLRKTTLFGDAPLIDWNQYDGFHHKEGTEL